MDLCDLMGKKFAIIILGIVTVIVFGLFVNPLFLYLGIFLLCPLMHFLGTCGMGHKHEEKNKQKKGSKKCH